MRKFSSVCGKMAWLVVFGSAALLASAARGEEAAAANAGEKSAVEAHRVVACYFHRTNRCPTCRKISAYIEESLNSGLAKEMKDGSVALQMIDFQDPKNQQYTDAYKITGPTLVIMDVRDGKVASWKPAPKVWSLVGKKDAFFKYVQDEVRAYLETK